MPIRTFTSILVIPGLMFRSPIFRSYTILSDGGFSVRLSPPYALKYKEADLEMDVSCDAVAPNIDVLCGTASAFRNGDLITLTREQERRIFDNITRALEWRGFIVHLR